jgi:ribonuclease HI
MVSEIIVYTDGSASVAGPMKGYSGFGTYFPDLFGKKKAFSLGFENGKTGEMEVLALYFAIKQIPIKESVKLIVYADSEYVVKTFTENRLEKWKKNGWTNTSGEVANKKLWVQIYSMLQERKSMKLELKHIKSHQVDREKDPIKKKELMSNPHIIGNLMADSLANYKRHTKRLLDTSCLNLN